MVSLIMRISETYTRKEKNLVMLAVNYAVCIVLAGVYTGFDNYFPKESGSMMTLGLGMINGLLYLLGFVFLQLNVKKNGVVMSATFMKLGVLVPTLMSVLVFGEIPTILQVIGFVIALAAIIGINMEKGTGDSVIGFKAGLIILLLAGGGGDAMAKVYDEIGRAELSDQFLAYTFVFAFLFCLLMLAVKHQKTGKMEIFFGILIAIPNYYSARFLLKAVSSIPAVVAYPSYSVATIITITTAGIMFFHEKINRRQMAALAEILVALVLLNV